MWVTSTNMDSTIAKQYCCSGTFWGSRLGSEPQTSTQVTYRIVDNRRQNRGPTGGHGLHNPSGTQVVYLDSPTIVESLFKMTIIGFCKRSFRCAATHHDLSCAGVVPRVPTWDGRVDFGHPRALVIEHYCSIVGENEQISVNVQEHKRIEIVFKPSFVSMG